MSITPKIQFQCPANIFLEEEHIRALRKLDFDLPDIADDDDDIDAGPSLWVDGFTDDEEEEIDASL